MKYVLLYTSTPDLMADVPEQAQHEVYQAIYGWFDKFGSVITDSGAELEPPTTATSVKSGTNGTPLVVDAPFSEAKESIGGFSVVDVPDLDAAIAVVKDWTRREFTGVAVVMSTMIDNS